MKATTRIAVPQCSGVLHTHSYNNITQHFFRKARKTPNKALENCLFDMQKYIFVLAKTTCHLG